MTHRPHCEYPSVPICMCEVEPEPAPSAARLHDHLCPMWRGKCLPEVENIGNLSVIRPRPHVELFSGDCQRCYEECWCDIISLAREDERRARAVVSGSTSSPGTWTVSGG